MCRFLGADKKYEEFEAKKLDKENLNIEKKNCAADLTTMLSTLFNVIRVLK